MSESQMIKKNKNTSLIDNKDHHIFKERFEKFCSKAKHLKIAVGYFYLSGFNLVKQSLSHIDKIQLIMGSETDISTTNEISEGYKLRKTNIKDKIIFDLNNSNTVEENISDLKEYIENDKIDIKIYTKNRFHPKAYIFLNKDNLDEERTIIGSSNFTKSGFGVEEGNIELNTIDRTPETIKNTVEWFDGIWEQSKDFKKELIKIIKNSEPYIHQIEKDLEYVIPIKLFKIMLNRITNNHVEISDNILTEFQRIGVDNAMRNIENVDGTIIADSVGLGKTFMGLKLIEIYQKKGFKILLIIPARIKSMWGNELNKNNIKDVEVKSITDISLLDMLKNEDKIKLDNLKKFDFILIDEAHQFKTNGYFDYDKNKYIKSKRYTNLRYISSKNSKIVLLTATPLNNSVMDLYNLINIFTDDNKLTNINKKLKLIAFHEYDKINNSIKKNNYKTPDIERLKNERNKWSNEINKVLQYTIILRTRTYINNIYKNIKINNIPITLDQPIVKQIEYKINNNDYTSLYDEIQVLFETLNLPHIKYTNSKHVGNNLSGLYMILLFKRLESSIYSFTESIKTLIRKEKNFEEYIKKSGTTINKKEYVDKEIDSIKNTDHELEDLIDEMTDLNQDRNNDEINVSKEILVNETRSDINLLEKFLTKCLSKIKINDYDFNDPKLIELEKIIDKHKKILIFTQYIDTAKYLFKNLELLQNKNIDCIVGKIQNKANDIPGSPISSEHKIKLFAPNSNNYIINNNEKEINILISTDALSEGVNLQDAHVIVNYDLPWNPMRIVQRVGRVNRIGNIKQTQVYNIFPDNDLELFLKILEKLKNKIDNLLQILGKECNILSDKEGIKIKSFGEEIHKFRKNNDIENYGKNNDLKFNSDDKYGLNIHELKKINRNLKNYDISNIPEHPYSIIRNKNYKGHFIMFEIFENKNNKTLKNIIIFKDNNNNYKEITLSDNDLQSFAFDESGFHKNSSTVLDYDKEIKKIEKYFKNEPFNNYLKIYDLIGNTNSSTQPIHTEIIIKLESILEKSNNLNNDITENSIKISKDLLTKFRKITISQEKIIKYKRSLIHQINNDNKYIEKLNLYYKDELSDNTILITNKDIFYKIICSGGMI